MTRHSVGVYSTAPTAGQWRREDPAEYQAAMERGLHSVEVVDNADGEGVVETYTVSHGGDGKPTGIIVIGRMTGGEQDGKRFVAKVPVTEAALRLAYEDDLIGRRGAVSTAFEPDAREGHEGERRDFGQMSFVPHDAASARL